MTSPGSSCWKRDRSRNKPNPFKGLRLKPGAFFHAGKAGGVVFKVQTEGKNPGAGVSRSRGGGKAARLGWGVRLAVICPAGHPAGTCLRRSPVFAAQAGFRRAKDEKVLSPIGENGGVCCRKMQQFGREWEVFEEVLCFAQVETENAGVYQAV